MINSAFYLAVFTFLCFGLNAQDFKKNVKAGEELYKKGNYQQAVELFAAALKEKDDEKVNYLAGDCYLKIRDYANAVIHLEKVKAKNSVYDKPGYKYAKALMQSGKYGEAKKEFLEFGLHYNGADKPQMELLTKMQMKGCDFGIENSSKDPNLGVNHADRGINSDATEFSPRPIVLGGREELWYATNSSGNAKIYKTKRSGKTFTPKEVPSMLNVRIDKAHLGHACFSPTGLRFYFTQCNQDPASGKMVCEIYLMEMDEKTKQWGSPMPLPEYINVKGKTATHPYVTIKNNKEMLFFVSDRDGGKGGLDIWYCSKSANTKGINFLNPLNLGATINSEHDEITPYYDPLEERLVYSSDGLPGLGGLDIYTAKGGDPITAWSKPENMGVPYSSAADDLYYVLSADKVSGYFVSNRVIANKPQTTNDDIFFFGKEELEKANASIKIKGKIVEANGRIIGGPTKVTMYDIRNGGNKVLSEKTFEEEYQFEVSPKMEYRITAYTAGFMPNSFEFETQDLAGASDFNQDITLEKPKGKNTETTTENQTQTPEKTPANKPSLAIKTKSSNEAKPFRVPDDPPANPDTGLPYEEGTQEFDDWLHMAEIAMRSKVGMVYYDANGNVKPFNPDAKPDMGTKPAKENTPKEPENTVAEVKKPTTKTPAPNKEDSPKEPENTVAEVKKPTTKPAKEKTPKEPKNTATETPTPNKEDSPKEPENTVAEAKKPTTKPAKEKTPKEPKNTATETPKSTGLFGAPPADIAEDEVKPGVIYKVQIAAVGKFRPEKFLQVHQLGAIKEEPSKNGKLSRIMVGDFDTIKKAREVMERCLQFKFSNAHIYKYNEGKREGEPFQ